MAIVCFLMFVMSANLSRWHGPSGVSRRDDPFKSLYPLYVVMAFISPIGVLICLAMAGIDAIKAF